MLDDLKEYFLRYIVLVIGLWTGFFFFFHFSFDKTLQIMVGILLAVFYSIWGIVHHIWEKDLTAKIVLEYLLVSGIAVVILIGLLLRT